MKCKNHTLFSPFIICFLTLVSHRPHSSFASPVHRIWKLLGRWFMFHMVLRFCCRFLCLWDTAIILPVQFFDRHIGKHVDFLGVTAGATNGDLLKHYYSRVVLTFLCKKYDLLFCKIYSFYLGHIFK